MKRIIIVDSQELFAATVATLVRNHPEWQVVDIFRNGRDATEKIPGRYADLVLMALDIPLMNGLESCRFLHQAQPRLPIILWEHYWSPSLIKTAKVNGANSILVKDISSAELTHAIQVVLNGQAYYSPAITEMLL